MTPEAFAQWVADAKEGHKVIYYEGFLGIDRWHVGYDTKSGLLVYVVDDVANPIGRLAWSAYKAGLVYLTQAPLEKPGYINDPKSSKRTFTEGSYAYLATRSHIRLPKSWQVADPVSPAVLVPEQAPK